mmetsp:Transcript_35144/g.43012  ORF Transcript_35144/g.43012 Transcript_35144/m.43012 type:complete len:146 (+) Transcript_35144:285-722(+)
MITEAISNIAMPQLEIPQRYIHQQYDAWLEQEIAKYHLGFRLTCLIEKNVKTLVENAALTVSERFAKEKIDELVASSNATLGKEISEAETQLQNSFQTFQNKIHTISDEAVALDSRLSTVAWRIDKAQTMVTEIQQAIDHLISAF